MTTFEDYKKAGFNIKVIIEKDGNLITVTSDILFKDGMLEEIIKFFDYKQKDQND